MPLDARKPTSDRGVLGTGLGAEARVGIGAASATGILVSGALTLYVLPSVYMLVQRFRKKPTSQN